MKTRSKYETDVDFLRQVRDRPGVHILEVVRPLCTFVAQLPEYTRRTRDLSPITRAVRDTILQAHEPATLVFKQLPSATGLKPFDSSDVASSERIDEFVALIHAAHEELKLAYRQLKSRMRDKILAAFEAPAASPLQAFRDALSERCENLLVNMRDVDLKAFCMRMLDSRLPESDWLESVGSFVANSPPSRWKDDDERAFQDRLNLLVQKFLRVESIYFSSGKESSGKPAFRISITARDGSECERVIHLAPDREAAAKDLEEQIFGLINQNDPASITAVSRIAWRLIQRSE